MTSFNFSQIPYDNFTLPDKMPISINFQISFTVNSEQSEPMLNVKHSTVNVQEVINLQDDSSDLNVEPLKSEDPISLDECFENVSLSDKTKKDYKGLIKQHMSWVSVYDTYNSKEKRSKILETIKQIDGFSSRKQHLCAMKKVLEQLNIEDIEVNKEVENIVKETQDKTAIESKQNLRPIKEAFTIMEWLETKLDYYKKCTFLVHETKSSWYSQMWAILECYLKYGVLRSSEFREMIVEDEDEYDSEKVDLYNLKFNRYYVKSNKMVIVNHKTNKKSKGKETFEPRVFDCELESFQCYLVRNLERHWFFTKKQDITDIYKGTDGINAVLSTALDLKGLSKKIGRQINSEDLRKAKVSTVLHTKDKEKINLLSYIHGTSIKEMTKTYQSFVDVN